MRILLATFTFSPNKDGVSAAASIMARGFLAKGWKVDIATAPSSPSRVDLNWNGAAIHEFSIFGSNHFRDTFRGAVQQYQEFLLSGKWEVIVFHSYSWTNYIATSILDRLTACKVLVSHGYGTLVWIPASTFPYGLGAVSLAVLQSFKAMRWMKKLDRIVFLSKRRDFLAFYDHTLARLTRHKGIQVIPNGVDCDEKPTNHISFREQIGAEPTTTVFLCVAYFSKLKDQGFAARAFRKAKIANSILVFIGTEFNEFSEEFQKADQPWATTNPPGKIIWLEKQDRKATLNAIAACDIFVLPSRYEAQPIVLLEAMREGKPWIARRAGCIPELPGGVCVKSEKQMATEMQRLTISSSLRKDLGKMGRTAVERTYNRNSYVSSYCQLIEKMVKSKY